MNLFSLECSYHLVRQTFITELHKQLMDLED